MSLGAALGAALRLPMSVLVARGRSRVRAVGLQLSEQMCPAALCIFELYAVVVSSLTTHDRDPGWLCDSTTRMQVCTMRFHHVACCGLGPTSPHQLYIGARFNSVQRSMGQRPTSAGPNRFSLFTHKPQSHAEVSVPLIHPADNSAGKPNDQNDRDTSCAVDFCTMISKVPSYVRGCCPCIQA